MISHIPDRRPREPDDLDFSGSSAYAVESDEQYRCPHCGYIGPATLRIQRQHGRDYADVECHECGADTLSETGDIATDMACQKCFHAVAMPNDDWCYTCAVAEELDEVSVIPRYHRAQEAARALPSVSEFIGSMFRDLYGVRS